MAESPDSRSERYLRFSHGTMVALLILTIVLGGFCLAMRVAFIVVLIAQIPIGLLVAHLPSLRAVMAMAISTLTLGMATLIALFLFFSREEQDG